MDISRMNNSLNMVALHNLQNLTAPNLERSAQSLASGLRINRAADDASGLVNANRLQTQISGLNKAFDAAQTGINIANIADQGLGGVTDRLQRIRDLVLQAGSGAQDGQSRRAIQDEIDQNVQEIGRIADTTQFNGLHLLNGDAVSTAGIRPGAPSGGISIAVSQLTTRENYFTVRQIQSGSAQIASGEAAGETQTVNAGVQNVRDIAVTQGTFAHGNAPAAADDALANTTFNGVSLQNGGVIQFQGMLADGKTAFTGSLSISAGGDVNSLVAQIQQTLDAAETAAGVNTADGTNPGETNAVYNTNTGRLEFQNGADQGVSRFQIQFNAANANGQLQTTTGITRAAEIGGAATGAQIGNSVTAITGNTFDTGALTLEIGDVTAANRRIVETNAAFQTGTGGPAQADSNLIGAVFEGVTLSAGDTIAINGTNADGTTFSNTITVSNVDLGAGQGDASTMQDLIDELNQRDRSQLAGGRGNPSGFEAATAQLAPDGRIQVVDDIAASSQTNFTLTVNDRSSGNAVADKANMVQQGAAQTASVSINGGPNQRVEAGSMATLYGQPAADGEAAPQITLQFGANLTAGTDEINAARAEYAGSLNGGAEVLFAAGQQNVQFNSGLRQNENAVLNFDAAVGVPGLQDNGVGTVVISATGREANFQIGANAGETKGIQFGDMRPRTLGLGEGLALENIDVTREGGVEQALQIADNALNQASDARSRIGAFSNGLEATSNQLAVASENYLASRSRLADADYAAEATRYASNQLLLQSNLLVQSQTNNLTSAFFLDLLR
ncbi:MAG: flagellin [Candidatus Omnitrophota bacterium]